MKHIWQCEWCGTTGDFGEIKTCETKCREDLFYTYKTHTTNSLRRIHSEFTGSWKKDQKLFYEIMKLKNK